MHFLFKVFVLYLSCEKNENKQKEAGFGPLKSIIFSAKYYISNWHLIVAFKDKSQTIQWSYRQLSDISKLYAQALQSNLGQVKKSIVILPKIPVSFHLLWVEDGHSQTSNLQMIFSLTQIWSKEMSRCPEVNLIKQFTIVKFNSIVVI